VCRGLQVLVVAFGGTLTADLGMSHVLPEVGHRVTTRHDSAMRSLLGERPSVTSLHHQAVADPGPCWRPTAWAADGVIEAAEWAGAVDWPVLGVQWHPELEGATGPALFAWLVEEARVCRARSRALT
jgi:putative glutamine amidotransferase